MSKLDLETEMKLYRHFALVCKKCGHSFLPWHSLSITTKDTGWESAFYCPHCHNLANKSDYDTIKI